MNSDLKRLVKDCIGHKRQAQKELYELFAPVMLGVCYRYTKNMHDAEDILQDGFVKVFKHLSRYRGEGDLGAWIRRIMVNTALTYMKTHRPYYEELFYDNRVLHPVSDDDPQVQIDTKELTGLIRQLPTGYQTIFNLHAVEGYSHVEIADMLGISNGTSRSQYARARSLLIQWIEGLSVKGKGGYYEK